ncbi:MAG TPA: DUF167 domain-containing protein [Candidatus Omnitrophota bacterium]|mgnify:CR=1 FL=1|nr:DUF167 domain-containing protein [Candidatus Omnitrophota bacterium]HPS20013.1 DUF167 domain-containing protein [Candidatus Omnitrophota bacterium]
MRLELKVYPGSGREELVEKDGVLKAYVKAAPDKGKANKDLIELIADRYNVPKSHVRIVTGMTSRKKIVEVLV